jgi:radical SAM superfamily enzyme YgiQ (UPF0313 family)
MTGSQIKWGIEASKVVREISPEVPIVWGGLHATLLPEQTLECQYVDVVVMGEGETVFLDLVRALEGKKDLEEVKEGICFEKDGKPFSLPRRDFIDLNTLPEFSFDLVNIKPYINAAANVFVRGARQLPVSDYTPNLPMITSRGCPHTCAYCYVNDFDLRKWRYLESETVIRKRRNLVEQFDLKAVYLLDDNFFVFRKRAEAICRAKLKDPVLKDIEIFNANCRYDDIAGYSPDLLRLIKEAGIRELRIGVEVGSDEELKRIMKQALSNQVIIANKKLRKLGVKPTYNFMVGLPEDTIEEAK